MRGAGENGRKYMPEFMKPKALRCSMKGHPWAWRLPGRPELTQPINMSWPTF
jgi:hypothetical protein